MTISFQTQGGHTYGTKSSKRMVNLWDESSIKIDSSSTVEPEDCFNTIPEPETFFLPRPMLIHPSANPD